MFKLRKSNLNSLLSRWTKEAELFTPQLEDGQVMLLPYEESRFTMDYVNFAFPVKEHLFKQREVLFDWKNVNGSISVEMPRRIDRRYIYFGVRPCDVYGIKYMDKFFLEGYRDEFYGRNRASAIIAAVNCQDPGENCFCSSMETGPFAQSGYDLLFTALQEEYLVEVGTDKGKELIAASRDLFTEADESIMQEKEAVSQTVLNRFNREIKAGDLKALLEKNFNNPIWQELAKECISCTGCTSLCPTCTCFNVVEEMSGTDCGCRVRYWDSCQSDSFTRNAKEHNPRSSQARFRYRVYDKFRYIEERFYMKGCTGCGKCADTCPASINVVEVINKLADGDLNIKGNGGE